MSSPRLACLAVFLSGCGLISSDVTDFNLRLPDREVTLDTADWQLGQAAMPAIDCTDPNQGVCSAGISQVCGAAGTCFGSCGGQTCDLKVLVSLWQTFNLAQESPELMAIDSKALVSVTIDRIWFQVTENTLDAASPPLTVYAAPQEVMDPGSPQAEEIGTIAPIDPGQLVDQGQITLSAGGNDVMVKYMKAYQTPFNLIVGGQVDFSAGDSLPTGRMVAVVKVDAHAGI